MELKIHNECLPRNGQTVLKRISEIINEHRFILAGGTALALRLGHRISVDLDFFTRNKFSTDVIFRQLKEAGLNPEVLQEEEETLTVMIDGVKVSMFHYPYPFLDACSKTGDITIAGTGDIASMKITAISQRGAKRDFIDLYFILQVVPFFKIAENVIGRFGPERINPVHIGKSLVYFNDADSDPEPQYLIKKPPKWEDIKKFFKRNVKQMVIDLQKAKDETHAAASQ